MNSNIRIYNIKDVIIFHKTKAAYGGLSNMCAGFPLSLNNVPIRTSEALYQALKFPDFANIQQQIIDAKSPMTAKMISRHHQQYMSSNWNSIRVDVMRYCLQLKLLQHNHSFGTLLKSTYPKPIVELSKKDTFWGAKKIPTNSTQLKGVNALGRLLMELRNNYLLKGNMELTVNFEQLLFS